MAILVLSLATPGLAAFLPDSSAAARTDNVMLAQSSGETPLEEETKTFDGVNAIGTELSSGSKLAVGQNSLKSPTPITLQTFDKRPEGGDPRFKPIGLRTVVELPLAQVNLSDPMTETLFIYAPALKGAYETAVHPVQEVTISVGKGKEYVFLDSYIPDFPVIITPAIIESVLDIYPFRPKLLRISVQPVDARDFFEFPAPDESSQSLRANEVFVQAQPDNPTVVFEETKTIGAEVIDGKHKGGGITIPNPDLDPCTARTDFCDYSVALYRGALGEEVDVILRVIANQQPTFSGQEAIGHQVLVELPLKSLTLDTSVTVMRLFAPTFPDAYEENLGFIAAEVQISFDGKVYLYLRDYGLGDPLWIYAGNIVSGMRELGIRQAETIRISVLPVSKNTFSDTVTPPNHP